MRIPQNPFLDARATGSQRAWSNGLFGPIGRSDANNVQTTIEPPDFERDQAILQSGAGPTGYAHPPQIGAYGRPIMQPTPWNRDTTPPTPGLSMDARRTTLGNSVQSNIDAANRTDFAKLAQAGGVAAPNYAPNTGINSDGKEPPIGSTSDQREGFDPNYEPGYGYSAEGNSDESSLTPWADWRKKFSPARSTPGLVPPSSAPMTLDSARKSPSGVGRVGSNPYDFESRLNAYL